MSFKVTEDKTGVFILLCQSCGHVLTAKHTPAEIEKEKAAHKCPAAGLAATAPNPTK